jgi:hypothetical protein
MNSVLKQSVKTLLLVFAFTLFTAFSADKAMADMFVTDELAVNGKPYRILAYHIENNPDQYWIVDSGRGLILLQEILGVWQTSEYPIGPVCDATGPTDTGLLYCTYYDFDIPESGIYAFDCVNRVLDHEIQLQSPFDEYSLTGLVLSGDQTSLYVCARTWPPLGTSYNWGTDRPDTGLVLEVDLQSELVTQSVVVRTRPETLHLVGNTRLIVSSHEPLWGLTGDDDVMSRTELIDLSTFQRLGEGLPCNYANGLYMNDFFDWDIGRVALVSPGLHGSWTDPRFVDSLWVLNPYGGQLLATNTIHVQDPLGNPVGINHATLCGLNDDLIYVSFNDSYSVPPWPQRLGTINKAGNVLSYIATEEDIYPEFIYEVEYGRIIVTCGWNRKILIAEGSPLPNSPPVCILAVETPMPYVGVDGMITFDATESYDPDPMDSIVEYSWDFNGDEIYGDEYDEGTDSHPVKKYYDDYEGFVGLRIKDSFGAETTCVVYVDIRIQKVEWVLPNGGETFLIGTNQVICWLSQNISGFAKIKLYNGSQWVTLSPAWPIESGFYVWTITGPETDQGLMRIESLVNPEVNDESDGYLSIIE